MAPSNLLLLSLVGLIALLPSSLAEKTVRGEKPDLRPSDVNELTVGHRFHLEEIEALMPVKINSDGRNSYETLQSMRAADSRALVEDYTPTANPDPSPLPPLAA